MPFRSIALLTLDHFKLSITEKDVFKSPYDYVIVYLPLKYYQLFALYNLMLCFWCLQVTIIFTDPSELLLLVFI